MSGGLIIIGLICYAIYKMDKNAKQRRAQEVASLGATAKIQKALYDLWSK